MVTIDTSHHKRKSQNILKRSECERVTSEVTEALEKCQHALTVLDLQRPDCELEKDAMNAISNGISPMFAVKNFGFLDLLRKVVKETHKSHNLDKVASEIVEGASYNSSAVIVLHAVDKANIDSNVPVASQAVRTAMRSLALRLSRILLGKTFEDALAIRNETLDGRLSLRYYPGNNKNLGNQLGAHIDGNLFTLLWADQPGLKVLNPALSSKIPIDSILQFGLPKICAVDSEDFFIENSHFINCGIDRLPGKYDEYILFTIGNAFLKSTFVQNSFKGDKPVQCAVLHKVDIKTSSGPQQDRHSIPYLVDIHKNV